MGSDRPICNPMFGRVGYRDRRLSLCRDTTPLARIYDPWSRNADGVSDSVPQEAKLWLTVIGRTTQHAERVHHLRFLVVWVLGGGGITGCLPVWVAVCPEGMTLD
jgi:hypothetical protein